jgi:cytosine deaminase
VQPEEQVERVIARVAEAGITIVSLPHVNQHLQDRAPARTPRLGGVTLLHELRSAGVPLLIGGDNIRDPFFAFGDHDMLDVFGDAVRIAHLDLPFGASPATVARAASEALRFDHAATIGAGRAADLVLFRARGMDELLARRRAERSLIRGGRPVEAIFPDHRELDRAV